MGMLDELMGQVAGSAGLEGADHARVMSGMLELIDSPQVGGLPGLIRGFESAGLGHLVQSWVGTGPNLQATPTQIQQGLGASLLNSLAQKLGMSPQMAALTLSVLLPMLIDRITPKGQLPAPAPAPSGSAGGGGLTDLLRGPLGDLLRGR